MPSSYALYTREAFPKGCVLADERWRGVVKPRRVSSRCGTSVRGVRYVWYLWYLWCVRSVRAGSEWRCIRSYGV